MYDGLLKTLNRSQAGVAFIDKSHQITYVNQVICDWTGYTAEEMLGHTSLHFIYEEKDKERIHEERRKSKSGKARSTEMIWKHKNGSKIYTLVAVTPMLDKDVYNGVHVIITNVTEMRKLVAEKHMLKGALKTAGSVCHEFNNPMSTLQLEAEMLMEDMTVNPELKPYMEQLSSIISAISEMKLINEKLQSIQSFHLRKYADGEILDLAKSQEPLRIKDDT